MVKTASYSGKAGTIGRPASGVSMGSLWNSAKQNSKVKPYQFEQRRVRPYGESPLEKSTYLTSSRLGKMDLGQGRRIMRDTYNRDVSMSGVSYEQAKKVSYN